MRCNMLHTRFDQINDKALSVIYHDDAISFNWSNLVLNPTTQTGKVYFHKYTRVSIVLVSHGVYAENVGSQKKCV